MSGPESDSLKLKRMQHLGGKPGLERDIRRHVAHSLWAHSMLVLLVGLERLHAWSRFWNMLEPNPSLFSAQEMFPMDRKCTMSSDVLKDGSFAAITLA